MFNITAVCAVNGREAVERFETDPPGPTPYPHGYTDAGYGRLHGCQCYPQPGKDRQAAGRDWDSHYRPYGKRICDDVYRAKQAGMDEHVTKPLESAVCWKSCTGTWTFQPGTVQNKSPD